MRAVILAMLVSLSITGCMAVIQGEGSYGEDISIADNNSDTAEEKLLHNTGILERDEKNMA